jgi:hypothetical protein
MFTLVSYFDTWLEINLNFKWFRWVDLYLKFYLYYKYKKLTCLIW